ncbi:MAG: phosphoglucosamine mutase, partial [Candidatus Aenigmatarchaeota archaeon]
TRETGEMIENSLTAGFLSAGVEVKELGVIPTPILGFSSRKLSSDVGAMITASHNPPDYNGIKFFDSRGMAISPEREKKIEEVYPAGDFDGADWDEIGDIGSFDPIYSYLEKFVDEVELDTGFKVVVDCANGPAAKVTPYLLERLGCDVITINSQLDGRFPGRMPEPTEENLRDL